MNLAAYPSSPPGVIKSVRQRWLFAHWNRLRGERPMPRWTDLEMNEIESCFDDMTFVELVSVGGRTGFRIVTHGKNVGSLYAGQCAGKMLDDTLPDATRSGILETYEQVRASERPVYTASRTDDAEGRPVFYERLLLPFGAAAVTHIAALLETISPEGRFERKGLLSNPRAASGYFTKTIVEAAAAV